MIQSSWPTMNWSNSIDESNSIDSTLDIVNKVERTISYTLTLKQKLGPRTCTAVEQQTLLMSESEFGKRYVIDAKVTNQAVPLCNCFCVISRYCLLCINSTTSRLHICSQVIYKKPVFFGAKSIIENTCHSGLTDFFNTLVEQLKEYTKDLSIEERLTGGWLTQKRDCKPLLLSSSPTTTTTAMITTPLPPPPTITTATTSSQMNHRIPRVIIQGDYKNKPTSIHSTISLNRENVNYTHHYNNNNKKKSSIPSRCSELMKSTAFNNYNNTGGMIIKRQNKTDTFASNTNDMTYLFMRPDRAWLLLVIISLLLCLFLSMVYNRLVVLEKLAEQFSPSSSTSSSDSRDQNHISDLFGSKSSEEENPLFTSSSSSFTIQNDQGSIPVYRSQSSIPSEWPRTKLKIMKDLIHLLSKTLTQMQQTLTQVRQGIELLETPPVNMPPIVTSGDDGDVKGNMNIPMMNPIVEYSSNTENNPVT
ncbi:unnamed protein product [Heterobilharzia americana]|nr:unnamed protein product [Heterobilharzia americana]